MFESDEANINASKLHGGQLRLQAPRHVISSSLFEASGGFVHVILKQQTTRSSIAYLQLGASGAFKRRPP